MQQAAGCHMHEMQQMTVHARAIIFDAWGSLTLPDWQPGPQSTALSEQSVLHAAGQ